MEQSLKGEKMNNIFLKLKNKITNLIAELEIRLMAQEIHYINGPETLPPPLSKSEEQELMNRIVSGDESARETLIVHNLRLVVYIAKKFENTTSNIEDLVSIGSIGLIKAVNTFSPQRNIKLATYASRCIENEILMFLRKSSNQRQEISIDEPLNTDYDGNELVLSDVLGSDVDLIQKTIDDEVDKQLLSAALKKLNDREKTIMKMRFGLYGNEEKTQKEVADMLGISQSYISRLEKRIISRLKKEIDKLSG